MKDSKTNATIHNEERKKEWMEILGTDTLPIKSILPTYVVLPGFEFMQAVYFLDVDFLEENEIDALKSFLAKKFDIDLKDVNVLFDEHGVPIRAADCTVATSDIAFLFNMIDDI